MFKLRVPKLDVPKWASRYDSAQDERLLKVIKPDVERRGYLERDEFLAVCRWKTPRSQSRCSRNDSDYIGAVTRIALSRTTPDRLKIQILTLLLGVGWPTASVILHLFDAEPFPILDYRALWSLTQNLPPQYSYDFWNEYTLFTRGLARKLGCDMRTLDRALWQYSKENQPSTSRD